MVRYLFYTIGDLTYQSPLVFPWIPDVLNSVKLGTKIQKQGDVSFTSLSKVHLSLHRFPRQPEIFPALHEDSLYRQWPRSVQDGTLTTSRNTWLPVSLNNRNACLIDKFRQQLLNRISWTFDERSFGYNRSWSDGLTDRIGFHVRRVRIVANSEYYHCHICPSVCPHISARLPLDRFLWNLVLKTFIKLWLENPSLVKIIEKYRAIYLKISVRFMSAGDSKRP